MTELKLYFPGGNTAEEVIAALKNEIPISSLDCIFNNDNFNASEGLREAILSNMNSSGKVNFLKIMNTCRDRDKHNRCNDFYLQCLEGSENNTKSFSYSVIIPLTLSDAKRFAVAIASNGNIEILVFADFVLDGCVFREEGTLECIFDAVLDNGVRVLCLIMELSSNKKIVKRLCTGTTQSKLATNTTLKILNLECFQPYFPTYRATDESNEGIKKLANIIKVNKGLQSISIPIPMITNVGRRHLMGSLRDNKTLVRLDTIKFGGENPAVEEDETERNESISLQSQIDRHMMLIKMWYRYKYKDDNNRNSISLDIYPYLLEKFADKPLLLFSFMQRNHPRIFTSFSTDQSRKHRRRRSMRILKKMKQRKVLA